jgi:hypothetical protein
MIDDATAEKAGSAEDGDDAHAYEPSLITLSYSFFLLPVVTATSEKRQYIASFGFPLFPGVSECIRPACLPDADL